MTSEPAEPPAGLTLKQLHHDFDRTLLTSVYRELLVPAFSADELDAEDAMAERLTAPKGRSTLAAIALGPDEKPIGALMADVDREANVLLLSYAAVRPGLRGRGVGTFLLTTVAEGWYRETEVALAVAEVHDPRYWSARGDSDGDRRLRLYNRMGARILNVPFIQPALGPGTNRVPGFFLLAFHVSPDALLRRNGHQWISSELLGQFVRNYFEDTEGVSDPYDPELANLLAQINRDELVELIDISDYYRAGNPADSY